MTARRRWAAAGIGLSVVALGLFIPEPDLMPDAPDRRPFVWGQDELWARLERDFDAARARGCGQESAAIDVGLSVLDGRLDRLESGPVGPQDESFSTLEDGFFSLAVRFGACPERTPELSRRVARLRRLSKEQSQRWDIADDPRARDSLYRLLYGSRAALEELLLQMDNPPGLQHGVDEPSESPSVRLHGVTLRSGDVLLSRGGAPTSAFIARGNDYPGNFSHVALLHVSDSGEPRVIESHIESGVGVFSAEHYLNQTKLRIMVLRLRADHPALAEDRLLPHRAATAALESALARHIPYDFAMDVGDAGELFCSEVASAAYAERGVTLWAGLSSMSSAGLTRWLARFGVEHFETLAPSDLEYDPQMRVVAEWRDPQTLFDDHVDNAILDAMLEGAERGDEVQYSALQLPLARLAKGYSWMLNRVGRVGPVPEGMSATTGLRVQWLQARHGVIREGVMEAVSAYRSEHGRRPAYWSLVRMARDAAAASEGDS